MKKTAKDEAFLRWAKQNPFLTGAPLVSFLEGSHGANAVVPLSGPCAQKRYIDGAALKYYDFMFQATLELSSADDGVNAGNLSLIRRWQAWIDEQEKNHSYPDFGADCSGYRLENMTGTPQLALVFEGKTGKYQMTGRLHYLERRSAPERSEGEGPQSV
jgi:hypothetical protein